MKLAGGRTTKVQHSAIRILLAGGRTVQVSTHGPMPSEYYQRAGGPSRSDNLFRACCKGPCLSAMTAKPEEKKEPAPVRTPEHLDGLLSNTVQQQLAVQVSVTIHNRSRLLLSAVDQQAGLIVLENPSTSMTWDDRSCINGFNLWHLLQLNPVLACSIVTGLKWMFVSNRPAIHSVARSCPHEPGSHQSVVGVTV